MYCSTTAQHFTRADAPGVLAAAGARKELRTRPARRSFRAAFHEVRESRTVAAQGPARREATCVLVMKPMMSPEAPQQSSGKGTLLRQADKTGSPWEGKERRAGALRLGRSLAQEQPGQRSRPGYARSLLGLISISSMRRWRRQFFSAATQTSVSGVDREGRGGTRARVRHAGPAMQTRSAAAPTRSRLAQLAPRTRPGTQERSSVDNRCLPRRTPVDWWGDPLRWALGESVSPGSRDGAGTVQEGP